MFNKIKWKDKNFYYSFEITEPVFNDDYFQFYNGNARDVNNNPVKLEYEIQVIDSNTLMVNGPFDYGFYVVIDNVPYPYFENEKPDVPETPEIENPEFEEPTGIYNLNEEDDKIFFNKLPENYFTDYVPVNIEIEEYTNEVYPDYPFRVKKHKFELNKYYNTEILSMKRNVIYRIKIYIDKKVKYVEEFKAKILSYFSTVKGLKTYIEDLQLNIPIKSDEELFKLIQENSVKLKRRFGLKEKYTEDPEYLPIFKEVVNLYCVKDLISISFINGNFITSGEKGTVSSLKLSKFSVDGDGGTNGYALSTDLIKDLISKAEDDLYQSLYKEPKVKIKGNKFKCFQQLN